MAKTRKQPRGPASRKPRRRRGGQPRRPIDLKPLKRRIQDQIDRLGAVERPGRDVKSVLAKLKRVQRDLTKLCQPTMMVGFP